MIAFWINSAIWLCLGVLLGVLLTVSARKTTIHEKFKKGNEEIDLDEKEEE
jgi:hypothetical protein